MISMSTYFGAQTRWCKSRASRCLYSRAERWTVMPRLGVDSCVDFGDNSVESVMAETDSTLR